MNHYFCILFVIILSSCGRPETKEVQNKNSVTSLAPDSSKTIVLSSAANENSLIFIQGYTLYSEIFKKLGYTFIGRNYPTERSLLLANSGYVDGDGGRIIDIDTTVYKHLIKINEPVFEVNLAAYTKNKTIKTENWKSFAKYNSFLIGYVGGSFETYNEIEEFVPEAKLVEISDTRQGCAMLAAGRIDIFIDVEAYMNHFLTTDTALYKSGVKCCGVLEKYKVYPYLNKKHVELIPKIDSVLRQMKTSGEYSTLLKQGFAKYLTIRKEKN